VEVRTAAEALDRAFGGQLSTLLIEAGQGGARRAELVQSFFQLAIAGRAAMVDWTPVADAARLASEHWSDLAADQRQQLSFVQMVAARHEGASIRASIPSGAWLESLPAPVRLDVLAHVVQQAADTSDPDPERAIELAELHLVRGHGAFVQHLRLLGALGRLLAFTGRLSEALMAQQETAQGFVERMEVSELSYPLSEWFRLAGALGDQRAFDAAEEMLTRGAQMHASDSLASPYVLLARNRAGVQLGHEADAIEEHLHALCTDLALPTHVRGSAARWLIRLRDVFGDEPCATDCERALRALGAGTGRDANLALRYLDLIELDRAVRAENTKRSSDIVRRLARREGGLVRNLSIRAPAGAARFEWLARVWPY
jgi:hypothetical protein